MGIGGERQFDGHGEVVVVKFGVHWIEGVPGITFTFMIGARLLRDLTFEIVVFDMSSRSLVIRNPK